MKHTIALLTVLISITAPNLYAQCDSLLQAMTSASGYRMNYIAANGVDTLQESVDSWCPKFVFDYMADSSQSTWAFSEFQLNRKKLLLAHWCTKRIINWSDSLQLPILEWPETLLNANSTTLPFTLHGDDSIHFYRTFHWTDLSLNEISFNRYVNPNSISYSVELVHASTGERIALLDTTAFAATTVSRKPSIYSWFPPASVVRYCAPSSLDSTMVFIRVNTWSRGAEQRPFVRLDRYGRMRSHEELGSLYWRAYADSVRANTVGDPPQCDLNVATTTDPNALVISCGSAAGFDHVAIYDLYGSQHWSSSVPLSRTPVQVNVNAGLYIVAAINKGAVTCTRSVSVP